MTPSVNRSKSKTAPSSNGEFERKFNAALSNAKKVLHDTKHCSMAETVAHSFLDKYHVVEVLTRMSVAAQFNTMMILLGVSPEAISNLRKRAKESQMSVSLRFESEEKCDFKFQDQIERKSAEHHTVGTFSSKKEYVITKVDRFHWEFTYSYRLFAFLGSDPKDELTCLTNGSGTYKFFTLSKAPAPRPLFHLCQIPDLNMTWLLEHSAEEGGLSDEDEKDLGGEEKLLQQAQMGVFKIDRFAPSCRTPTRNDEIEEAWEFARNCSDFWEEIRSYFHDNVFAFYRAKTSETYALGDAASIFSDMFVPVLPIMRDALSPDVAASASLRLSGMSLNSALSNSASDLDLDEHQTLALVHQPDRSLDPVQQTLLLQLQCRTLGEKVSALKRSLPEVHSKIASQTDGRLVAAGAHMTHICDAFLGCVDYMEQLLRKQLIVTIGRELVPKDFDNYMLFHNHRIFSEPYAPKVFSYQVRTAGRPSEGIFSLLPLTQRSGNNFVRADPYKSFVSHDIPREPFAFAINSSTNVRVQGERYLHSIVINSFSGEPSVGMRLSARSRPFCNFIVIAGRMSSNNTLDPEIATVVQRKDEIDFLLKTEPIPAPKAFRDAISSLSPEMQRFAKAFRSMQLSSTLFGVCILEIKPQVERALALPEGSLYKETELMDEVIDLFLEYNIPADLMSYDGSPDDHPDQKVERVKELVSQIQKMIEGERQALLPPPPPPSSIRPMAPMAGLMSFSALPRGPSVSRGPPAGRGGGPPGGLGGRGRGMGRISARNCAAPPMAGAPPPMPGGGPPPPPPAAACGGPPPPPASGGGPPPPPAPGGGPPPPPGPPGDSPPAPPSEPSSKPEEKKETTPSLESGGFAAEGSDRDVTKVPTELDGKFDKLDPEGAVRPTILKFEGDWWMKSFESLLSPPKYNSIGSDDKKKKKSKAFDLLDSITRSGALPYVGGQLHIVTVLTHCFEDSLINTLWLESVNPIERVEATGLIAASVVHQVPPTEMVVESERKRIKQYSRGVFEALEMDFSE